MKKLSCLRYHYHFKGHGRLEPAPIELASQASLLLTRAIYRGIDHGLPIIDVTLSGLLLKVKGCTLYLIVILKECYFRRK
jgi:hypothetical protein